MSLAALSSLSSGRGCDCRSLRLELADVAVDAGGSLTPAVLVQASNPPGSHWMTLQLLPFRLGPLIYASACCSQCLLALVNGWSSMDSSYGSIRLDLNGGGEDGLALADGEVVSCTTHAALLESQLAIDDHLAAAPG